MLLLYYCHGKPLQTNPFFFNPHCILPSKMCFGFESPELLYIRHCYLSPVATQHLCLVWLVNFHVWIVFIKVTSSFSMILHGGNLAEDDSLTSKGSKNKAVIKQISTLDGKCLMHIIRHIMDGKCLNGVRH